MQNKYIRAILDNHNEFRVEADFIVLDIMAFGIAELINSNRIQTKLI